MYRRELGKERAGSRISKVATSSKKCTLFSVLVDNTCRYSASCIVFAGL